MATSIVVLDDCDLTDEHHRRLDSMGTMRVFTDNPGDQVEVLRRLENAEIAILGWTDIGPDVFERLPVLRMISVWATGYDYVDVRSAGAHGVTVTNVPAYASTAVAELTVGLMLTLTRHIVAADKAVRGGTYGWQPYRGIQLRGRTLGLVGIGDIGAEVARLASTLGMRVIAHTRRPSEERAATLGVEFTDLPTLLRTSDVVSLHAPLTAETRGMIGTEELRTMRDDAYLVNTARAGLVDQTALAKALGDGTIAGASLDDMTFPDETLVSLPNVVLTPHIGFFTAEALVRKGDICLDNVKSFLAGTPTNVVNAAYLQG